MSESGKSPAQPRMRDVIAALRPQVTFWWGSFMGAIVAAGLVVAMFVLGIFTFNTSGLVSLDSEKVALRIQLELEEAGLWRRWHALNSSLHRLVFSLSAWRRHQKGM
jgi:hypothetical protein